MPLVPAGVSVMRPMWGMGRGAGLRGWVLAALLSVIVPVLCWPGAARAQSQAGADYTAYFRWDAARRVVGMIHPDPDGAGPLPMTAERFSYDVDGQVTTVEQGTVTGVGDADWAGFVALQKVEFVYDAAGRKVRETAGGRLTAGAAWTPAALSQVAYDQAGRSTCVAVRMNAAAFATAPADACALGTPDGDVQDRVSKTVYDLAGRPTQVLQAAGSADQRTYSSFTYTANGQKATITDANLNTTAYSYDGFDRLVKTSFPSKARGSATASTTDVELYDYDANGNRTRLTKRDGEAISGTQT